MPARRITPRRYQLKKEAARVVLSGHPWLFNDSLSTAVDTFAVGQWLKLVDPQNTVLGYGIFDRGSLIGIRVLKRGTKLPDKLWLMSTLEKALLKRTNVSKYAEAIRVLHGENDNVPGVVLDVYGKTGVLQTYSPSVDSLGRYLAALAAKRLSLENIIWKLPVKRKTTEQKSAVRVLRGRPPGAIKFREGKMNLTVEVMAGQKSGTFLDLRGLRKWVSMQPLHGKRVLNVFSYTGTLGLAAEVAGAKEIWNVDIAAAALEYGKKHHAIDHKKYKWIEADVFEWVSQLKATEKFDVIIVDPPMMASRTSQVPTAIKAYQKIYRALLPHLLKGGTLVACCCTSRIARKRFRLEMDKIIGGRLRMKQEIQPEEDHPVGFPEGDYLKLLVYR